MDARMGGGEHGQTLASPFPLGKKIVIWLFFLAACSPYCRCLFATFFSLWGAFFTIEQFHFLFENEAGERYCFINILLCL